MGVWGGWPCTAVASTCSDKEAGSNGVGFSMDTRLLGPKGMNGLKKLSSTRLLAQTNLPTMHQPSCRLRHRSDTQLGSSPTHTHDSPPSDQQVHSKVSLRRAVDAVQRWRVRVFEPAVKGGKAARRPSSLRTWR